MIDNPNCKHWFYTCAFIGDQDFCNGCEDGSNYEEEIQQRRPAGQGNNTKTMEQLTNYSPKIVNGSILTDEEGRIWEMY